MQRPHRRPRTPERKPDLFPPNHLAASGVVPIWGALPERTRQALTGLLARLFMAHIGLSAPAPGVMLMSAEKVGAQHLARTTVLYVHQS